MIYFCIPAHNEERTVGVVLWKLRQVMAELNRDYQIIVVDDASTDSTPAVLSPYIRVLPLTVVRNSQRRGYAAALEVAIREAVRRAPYPKRDAVITLQADFTEDPDVVPALVKKIEAGADIVATSVEVEAQMPRAYRWGRRLFHWMVRGRAWAMFGDAMSGLRAYRVVTMKRALDARGAGRLLSWNGWGANVELLSVTVPHSRRTDVVESTLKHHRRQRESRFSFMEAMREVRGAASGKPNARAAALPTDGVVATPLPIAVEQAAAREVGQGHGRGHTRGETKPHRARVRDKQGPRPEKRDARPPKGPRPKPERVEAPAAPVIATPAATEGGKRKKRRRPRRRKDKKTMQDAPQLVIDEVKAPVETSPHEDATPADAPKKKSRRGRRGGRGRRRGLRPTNDGNSSDTQVQSDVGEAPPPPMAAEGD